MKPQTEIAAQAIRRIFQQSGDYSSEEAWQIAFHLTDWIDDLTPFVEFLENPGATPDDEVMRIIIRFLAHAPDHLKTAAERVLDPR